MTPTRSRPSAGLVVAAAALTLALAGTAIAGPDALVSKAAITKSQVKSIANKRIAKAAPGLTVKHAATAGKATTADDAQHASTADSAVSANTAAPTGVAGGALSGDYPNPELAKTVVPLTLSTGWTQEAGFAAPAVWKDAYNVVHFIGGIERTSGTAMTAFTLPPEFRPTTSKNPVVTVQSGVGYLAISSGGSVAPQAFAGASAFGFTNIEDATFEAGT